MSLRRYIATQTHRHVRFVGLSTALANAQDLADWLGIRPAGLFNFKPSVRPVPLEVHIQGYPGGFGTIQDLHVLHVLHVLGCGLLLQIELYDNSPFLHPTRLCRPQAGFTARAQPP